MITTLTPQQIQVLTAMGQAPTAMPGAQAPQQPTIPFTALQGNQAPAQPAQPAQQPGFQAQFTNPQAGQQNILAQRVPALPNIPQAFHGRTIEEVINGFARTAQQLQTLQRQPQQPTQSQAQQPTQQQPSQFGQPPAQFGQQPGQQQQPIQTPAGMSLEAVQQVVQQTIQQSQLPQLVMQQEQAIMQTVPAYSDPEIRGRVQEIIGQLPQDQQAVRGMWEYAITMAIGEKVQRGGQLSGFVQPTTQNNAPYVQGQRPADNQLMNPGGMAFVEAPTGNANYSQGQRPPLTQGEAVIATKFGLDPAQVAAFNQQHFGAR